MDVYGRLFLLNRSFACITQLLDELAQSRIYEGRELREMRGLTEEVQLEINTKLLTPLESAEQNDHTPFGRVGIRDEQETLRQVARSKAQISPAPLILLSIVAALNILLLVASLFVKPGADWVYHSQDGMPAPCPPPHRGLFPRDCRF